MTVDLFPNILIVFDTLFLAYIVALLCKGLPPIQVNFYKTKLSIDLLSIILSILTHNSLQQTLMYLRLFAHILVGFLIGALYYDIGNDGSKVLSNLGFLFFNMLFLMYTSMTITILSCEYFILYIWKNQFLEWM